MAVCVGTERNRRTCPELSCSCAFFCSSCQSISTYSCKLFRTLNIYSCPQISFLRFFKEIMMVLQCYWTQKFYLLPENQAQVSANKTYGGVCPGLALPVFSQMKCMTSSINVKVSTAQERLHACWKNGLGSGRAEQNGEMAWKNRV